VGGDVERVRGLVLGVGGELVWGGAKAVDTVAVEIALPGKKLVDRDAVEIARLLNRDPPAAHGFNDGGFAPHRPALTGSRQVRDLQNIGRIPCVDLIDLHVSPIAATARWR